MNRTDIRINSNLLPHNETGREFLAKYQKALEEIHRDVIELYDVIEQIFVAVLADGHVILEGEPGVGKTLVINTIFRTINAICKRIQFTPETLPSDMYYSIGSFDDKGEGRTLRESRLAKGPLFTQILIGDEINRANPRALAPLLEPLEEKQITIEGKTTPLGDLYVFAATQNPVESAQSTSELPEAQRERMLLMVHVPYPSPKLLRKIAVHDTRRKNIESVLEVEEIVAIQNATLEQYVLRHDKDDPVICYIQNLVTTLHEQDVVRWGPGVRAAQDLTRASAVHAFLHGSDHIRFEDIQKEAFPALRFKFACDARKARHAGINSNDDVIKDVIKKVSLTARGG